MAITAAGMRAFRSAATLVDVLPKVCIQVRDGDRVLLTVARRPQEGLGGLTIPPCGFRTAVAHAARLHRQGTRFQFLDLPADREPAIHVGLPSGDVVLPGSVYRVRASDERYLLLFMTDLDVDSCEQAITDTMATTREPGEGPSGHGKRLARRIGFHADGATQLTVVHAMTEASEAGRAGVLMTRLLEVCVAAEVIAELESTPPPSRDGTSR